MEIEITTYQNQEYTFLKDMIFDLYGHDFEDNAMTEMKIKDTINYSISNPEQLQIKIFKKDKTILGYAIVTLFWSNEYGGKVAILDELYVLPSHRNKGISSYFISLLCKNKNYNAIALEVVKTNSDAFRLYQKLGFEIIDRHFMKKTI